MKGFKCANRKMGQDFDHALMVYKNLGRFHGLSRALLKKGQLDAEIFRSYILTSGAPSMVKIYKGGLEFLVEAIRNNWGREW